MMKKMVVLVGVLAMLASSAVAGPLAGEIPQGSATVDGDLSDWAGAAWRTGTLQMNYFTGTSVPGNEDLDLANTRWAARWEAGTGGNPGHVYAALEVVDTVAIRTDVFTEWCASDRVEWFVHGPNNTGATYYANMIDAQQYVMGPTASDPQALWVEMGYKKGSPAGIGLAPETAVSTSGNTISYEVKIPVYDRYGGMGGGATIPAVLAPGVQIGFDLLVGSAINPYPGNWVNTEYYLVDETGVPASSVHKADGPSTGMQEFLLVPEPMTMSLLALGAIGVIRRKK